MSPPTNPRRQKFRLLSNGCAAVLSLSLSACSSEGSSEWAAILEIAKSSFASPASIPLEQAAAIPYASIGVRIDGSRQSLGVLATDIAGQKLWAVGPKITLVTVDGRIQRTAGLPHDLSWTTYAVNNARTSLVAWQMRRQVSWTADFRDIGLYSVQIVCDERPAGNETLTILGAETPTMRVNAHCVSASANWTFDNVYWIGLQDGLIWRSIQYIHPRLGPVEMETLRPVD